MCTSMDSLSTEYGYTTGKSKPSIQFPSLEGKTVLTTLGCHVKLGMRLCTLPSTTSKYDTEQYYCTVLERAPDISPLDPCWQISPDVVIHSDQVYDNIVLAEYEWFNPADYEDPAKPRSDAERAAAGFGSAENPQPNEDRPVVPYYYNLQYMMSGPYFRTVHKPSIILHDAYWATPFNERPFYFNIERVQKMDRARRHFIPDYENIMLERRIARQEAFYREHPEIKAEMDRVWQAFAEELRKNPDAFANPDHEISRRLKEVKKSHDVQM